MVKFRTNTQYVADGFDKDGKLKFREAKSSELKSVKHLEMVFAPFRALEEERARTALKEHDRKSIAKALRVPEALLK